MPLQTIRDWLATRTSARRARISPARSRARRTRCASRLERRAVGIASPCPCSRIHRCSALAAPMASAFQRWRPQLRTCARAMETHRSRNRAFPVGTGFRASAARRAEAASSCVRQCVATRVHPGHAHSDTTAERVDLLSEFGSQGLARLMRHRGGFGFLHGRLSFCAVVGCRRVVFRTTRQCRARAPHAPMRPLCCLATRGHRRSGVARVRRPPALRLNGD